MATDINKLIPEPGNKPFLSAGWHDALKAFWMFLISAIVSIVGDAITQSLSNGTYSLDAIHWKEIGAAVLVAVVAYIQKQLFTNSNGQFMKKDTN